MSLTIPKYPSVKRAIAGIGEAAWTPIRYPKGVWDEQGGCWISDAEIAEAPFLAFTTTKHQVWGRLIVRRVKDRNHQDALFAVWRYHACFTTSDAPLPEAEATHRAHAIIEHVNDDLKAGPLAHIPSGDFGANAAWLTCAALAFNLTRAAGALAGPIHARARAATIRAQLINIPARLARRARHLMLHLPRDWPWAQAWTRLHTATHTPP